jgi:hypothetical protein
VSNLVHNERVKLAATFCNNFAVATLVAGFLVPALSHPTFDLRWFVAPLGGVMFAYLLHLYARWYLGLLKE